MLRGTETIMRSTAAESAKNIFEGIRERWREVSRAYCQRIVAWSLAAGPLGGHDWFLEVERVTR